MQIHRFRLLLKNSIVGFFTSHKNQNSERTVRPHRRRLERLTILDARTKAAHCTLQWNLKLSINI